MNKEMFERLSLIEKEKTVISAEDLLIYGCNNRTLLYGYTCERETFHVYIKDKKIHAVVYNTEYYRGEATPKNMRKLIIKSNEDYIPDKRLYPERCNYEFCRLLKEKGVHLPFTTWNDTVDTDRVYFGFTLEDIK